MTHTRTTPTRCLAAIGVLAAVSVGCSLGNDGGTDAVGAPRSAEAEDRAAPDIAADSATATAEQTSFDAPFDQRVITTARLSLSVTEADDVGAAVTRASSIAASAGGYVQERQASGRDHPTALIVLRVPPERLDAAVEELSALGNVESGSLDTDDVTDEYTDVSGRIAALERSTARLRELISEAGDVTQIAAVEAELTRREQELESMLGRRRVLDDQTLMSTLTVEVRVADAIVTEAETTAPSALSSLEAGWAAFRIGVGWVVAVLAALLPFIIVTATAFFVLRVVSRLRRSPQSQPTEHLTAD